jgi:putative acetyltransferase
VSDPDIRAEADQDVAAIAAIHRAAFGQDAEAVLVDRLRESADPYLSLVACASGAPIGHILFTPVTVDGADSARTFLGLGPMAVVPALQRSGVGSQLVRAGLRACRERSPAIDAVFVLGHPEFYPRFGFELARPLGLLYESEAFAPAFFVHVLRPGALAGASGRVRYLPAFDAV